MAIEQTSSGAIIVTGRQDINTVAILSLVGALALEINTGMQASRISALQGAKNLGVIPQGKRGNKKQALRLAVAKLQEARPEYVPSPYIQTALDK